MKQHEAGALRRDSAIGISTSFQSNFLSIWQIICLCLGSPWPLCAFYHPEPSHRAAHWTARPSLSPDLLSERLWSLGVRPQPGGTLITGSALRYASLSPQQQINSTYLSLSPRSVRMEQLFMEQKGRGIMGDVPRLTAPFVFFGALRSEIKLIMIILITKTLQSHFSLLVLMNMFFL